VLRQEGCWGIFGGGRHALPLRGGKRRSRSVHQGLQGGRGPESGGTNISQWEHPSSSRRSRREQGHAAAQRQPVHPAAAAASGAAAAGERRRGRGGARGVSGLAKKLQRRRVEAQRQGAGARDSLVRGPGQWRPAPRAPPWGGWFHHGAGRGGAGRQRRLSEVQRWWGYRGRMVGGIPGALAAGAGAGGGAGAGREGGSAAKAYGS